MIGTTGRLLVFTAAVAVAVGLAVNEFAIGAADAPATATGGRR